MLWPWIRSNTFWIDHVGEQALFVNVRLKSGKERLAPEKSVDLQLAMRDVRESTTIVSPI